MTCVCACVCMCVRACVFLSISLDILWLMPSAITLVHLSIPFCFVFFSSLFFLLLLQSVLHDDASFIV